MGQRKRYDKAFKEQAVLRALRKHCSPLKRFINVAVKPLGSPQIKKNLPTDLEASRGHVARLIRKHGMYSKVTKK